MTDSPVAETATKKSWLASPPPAPRLPDDEVKHKYPKWRFNVFMGIFIGYAGFYLIRNNIPLVASLLQDAKLLDKVGIGIIANAALIAYGLSKFIMAMLSDKSNARYFLPIGLALSALANLVVAFVPGIASSVALFSILMFINGWFQGMGWPPCGRVLVHWFSTNERGWKTSIWNTAHNVGGVGVGLASAWALSFTGNQWQAAFWFPSLIALVVAAIAFFMIRDTPESMGLPPIEEFRSDPPKVEADVSEHEKLTTWEIVVKHVLLNKTMVFLALANVFIYALRYGVLNWTPIFLKEVHHASVTAGIMGFSLFELAGIFGTLACGWASDHVFRGNRTNTGLFFMVLVGASVLLYWLSPMGTPYWLLMVYLFLIGACIYGPVMLIGLQAIDMSAKHVAGTSAGFTGLFGYVIGATMASTGTGYVIQHFGWNVTFGMFIVFVVLTMVLLLFIYKDEKRLIANQKAKAAAKQ